MPMLATPTTAQIIPVRVDPDTSYEITVRGIVRSFSSRHTHLSVGGFVRARSGIPTIPEQTPGIIVHIRVHPDHQQLVCAAFMHLPMHLQKEFRMHDVLQLLFARDEAIIIVHFAGEEVQAVLAPEQLEAIPPDVAIIAP